LTRTIQDLEARVQALEKEKVKWKEFIREWATMGVKARILLAT
jgi:hypothetical protein